MIRSRSIPIVLSRVAGDGIHAILLIDNDGELLGSYGSPPPRHPAQDETNCGGVASGGGLAAAVPDMKWPLDAASIGALISEVAGDYSRMGEDLLLLDPRNYSQRHQLGGGSGGGVDRRRGHEGGQIMDNGGMQQPGGVDSGPSSLQQSGHNARKPDKDKLLDSGTNLKSLVVELDYVSAVLGASFNQFMFWCPISRLILHIKLSTRIVPITITRESLVLPVLGLVFM